MTNNSENDEQDSVDEELGQVGESLDGITDRFTRDNTQADEQGETSETIETSETTTTHKTTETNSTTETSKIPGPEDEAFQLREHWNGRTIYLPDELVKDLDLRYQELNLEWQREYSEELPKNEQFYPAVVRAALDQTSVEAKLGLQGDE